MNIENLKHDFNRFCSSWENTYECNNEIYTECNEKTNTTPILYEHYKTVEDMKCGYGEKAFRYMWATVISQLPCNSKFVEIGVFKGSVLSLVELISIDLQKNISVFGVSPLTDLGDKYSQYPPDDYYLCIQKLYSKFNIPIEKIKVFRGISADSTIQQQVKSYGMYDLVYIDGGHDYETVCNDIEFSYNILSEGGLIVTDDSSYFLNISKNNTIFTGHYEVSKAIQDKMENSSKFKHLFACGHNRVWRKLS